MVSNQKGAGRTFDVPVKESYKPIAGYGIIGNTRTVALAGYDGSIDWCCLPKFDSPSVFAAILDAKKGGRWTIQPAGRSSSTQLYLEDTNILRTDFKTPTSHVHLTDFMPCSMASEAWSTPPEIHRVVSCITGSVDMRFVFKPAFDYGLQTPDFEKHDHGLAMKDSKYEMALSWSVPFQTAQDGVDGTFRIEQGEKRVFVLSYGEAEPRKIEEYHTERQRAKTEVFWMDWTSQLRYRGMWRREVIRSALTLKLLVYSPTGAIVAAPTASLPEALKGNRNWDYRYSWIRDSANSLWAFYIMGYKSEAETYLHWLIDSNPSLDLDLRLMYDVDGSTNITERVLKHLEGYMGSGPVRVGNAAVNQLQLDAYGYMLDSLYFSHRHGKAVNDEMYYRFVKPLANYIVEHWFEPGNGIWEIRNRQEHYVYTKAWSWAGLDRAVKIAKATGHLDDVEGWTNIKRKIKTEVLRKGWNSSKKSFVMHYGTTDLDASILLLPLIGFIEVDDERTASTVDAIRRELGRGSLLYRYRCKDGLRGSEGAFLLCGFWLVSCLAKMGRTEEARKNFEELAGYANHLGLFSEEVDPETRLDLGNFPQAFSHMGYITAAHELDKAMAAAEQSRGGILH